MSDTPEDPAYDPAALDEICDAFESAWKNGSEPSIESFLSRAAEDQRSGLVVELIHLDRFYRQARRNELDQKAYAELLPAYRAEIQRAFAQQVDQQATMGFSADTVYPSAAEGNNLLVPQPGERVCYFGDYEIESEIARGGMGVVYRARQLSLNRTVALKMILSGHIADKQQVQRFKLEAEAVANLDHPGIVPIYDIGEHNGQHYFCMKLIEGKTLGELAGKLQRDRSQSIDLVAQVSDAVHHAHQRGILHRDLKPGNILVEASGQPIVMDFGLARNTARDQDLTQTGAIVGTPGFMSPEQAAGDSVTTATDIYSLGAILYQLVCGRPPHQGESVMKTVLSVMHDEPPRPTSLDSHIPTDLELIILKCLNKVPNQRYSSAAALATDLRAHLANEPVSVRSPSILEITRLWLSKNYGNILWVPIIAVVVGVLTGLSMWITTFGQDVSFKVSTYEQFPASERPWMARNWRPFGTPAMLSFLLLISTIGWLTTKLVRTKNRAADVGAGLSVGVLAGLIAFASGMGAVLLETSRLASRLDHEFLYQLAFNENRSYAHERLVTHYPTLEPLSPRTRTTLLNDKLMGDQWTSALTGIAMGAFFGVSFYAMIGLAQSLVAGHLIRTRNLWLGLFSYLCFSYALAIATFCLAGPTSMYFLLGSTATLNWFGFVIIVLLAAMAIVTVLRDWHWLVQLSSVLLLSIIYFPFASPDSPTPFLAQLQTEVKRASSLLNSAPDRRDFALRVVRAHHEYANALRNLGKKELARQEYAVAMTVLEKGFQPDTFKQQERILYSQLLSDTAYHAADMKSYAESAGYFAKHTRIFQSPAEMLEAYVMTVEQSKLSEREFLRETSAVDAYSWWQFAGQARSIAGYKDRNNKGSGRDWLEATVNRALETTQHSEAYELWSERKSKLRTWLLSRQHWDLYAPSAMLPDESLQAVLERELPIEAKLLRDPESLPTSKSIEAYVGTKVDLIRELGKHENSVCYARCKFKLDKPQQIKFRFGCDDSIKIWLDGQTLMQYTGLRSVYEGNDVVITKEPLSAGEHTLVVKVVQVQGGWGFVVDAADAAGWPLDLWHTQHE